MIRQSIFYVLLLSLILTAAGCSAEPQTTEDRAGITDQAAETVPDEAAKASEREDEASCAAARNLPPEEDAPAEESAPEELSESEEIEAAELKAAIVEEQSANAPEQVEDITGIFERLEDNHTAIFSFNGEESPFYFEDPNVQKVLSEAVVGSSYTFSYRYLSSLGLNSIYKITEN